MPGEMGNIFRYGAQGTTDSGSGTTAVINGPDTVPHPQEISYSQRRNNWDSLTKGQLAETLGTISHELRTPLTAMKASLRVVLDMEAGPVNSDQKRFLDMTMRNIDRLDRLVGDLLVIARSECASGSIKGQKIDLRQVFEDVAVANGPTARQRKIQLLVYPPRPGFRIWADPDKLMQIISNVLSNALKYTSEGGLVQMFIEESGPDIAEGVFALTIKDNGRGMCASQVTNMFKPYVRCHDQQVRDIPGSGLGLHITRGLVEAHGGSIDVGSAPGIGTEVRIKLPVKAP